jgi:hypothetical protein
MIDKIKSWALGVLVKKFVLGWAISLYGKLTGYRTALSIAGMCVVYVMSLFGLDQSVADAAYKFLGGVASFAFLEKLLKYQSIIQPLIADMKSSVEAQKEVDSIK